MADAFRGLTLKIGADVSPLVRSFTSITRAASQTQSQINKMNKALRFDPTNVAAISNKLTLIDDKMRLTARNANLMRTSMKQVANEQIQFSKYTDQSSGSMAKLAGHITDSYNRTQKVRAELNRTNEELEVINNAMVRAKMGKDNIASFDEAKEAVKKLHSSMKGFSQESTKAKAEMKELAAIAVKDAEVAERFNFGPAVTTGNRLVTTYKRLAQASKDLNKDLANIKKIEGFRAIRTQVIAAEAELRQMGYEAAEARTRLHALGNSNAIAKSVSEMHRMDAALEQISAASREASATFDMMPKSVEAARAKFNALKNEQAALKEQLAAVKNHMQTIANVNRFEKQKTLARNTTTEIRKLNSEYAETTAKIKKAEAAMDRLNAEIADLKKSKPVGYKDEMAKLESKVIKVENAIERMNGELIETDKRLENAAMAQEFQKANAQALKLDASLKLVNKELTGIAERGKISGILRTAGYGLYSTLTPAILIAGRYAVEAANEIDAAYRNMRKTVNGTEEEFVHLKDAAIEFSRTHVTSADTILEIEAMGGQLGIAVDNLEAFSEVVSNLDVATDIDAETMAKYVGQLSNIMWDIREYKDDPDEYRKKITSLSDALVRLGNNSAAQESSIMKVMMRIASMGSISGMTTPQLLAISTAVAAAGQGSEAAGTAISRTFSNIEQAVSAGKDDLENFAKVADMSASDFAAAWKEKPSEAFISFIEGLKRIKDAGGSVDATLAGLGINSVRQKQTLMNLVETFDVLKDSFVMSQDAWDGMSTTFDDSRGIVLAGDAAREASRKSEGFSGALSMMKNNAMALAETLSEGAAPWIQRFSDLFTNLTGAVRAMSPAAKEAIVGIAGIAASLGPALVAIGAVSNGVTRFVEAFDHVGKMRVFKAIATESKTLGMTFNELCLRTDAVGSAAYALRTKFEKLGNISKFALAGGVLAAVAAIAAIATVIGDAMKKAKDYDTATWGLAKATEKLAPAFIEAKNASIDVSSAFSIQAKSADDLIDAQARMTEAIDERNEKAATEVARLTAARDVIDQYLGKTIDSVKEQGRFRAAVETLNDVLGTHYQVLDAANGVMADENGAIQNNIEKIDEYIEKKKQQIQVEAATQNLAALYENQGDAAATYSESLIELADAQEALNNATADQKENASLRYSEAVRNADIAKKALDANSEAIEFNERRLGELGKTAEETEKSITSMAMSSEVLNSIFGDNTNAYTDFVAGLEMYGVKVDDFKKVTVSEWSEIVAAWNGGARDLGSVLEEFGLISQTLAERYQEAMEKAGTATTSFGDIAEKLGYEVEDDLADALAKASISMEDMAKIGSEAFIELASQAGDNLEVLRTAIMLVNQTPLEAKDIEIDDGAIYIAGQELTDLNNIVIGDKTFKLTANGFEEVKANLEEVSDEADEVDEKTPTVNTDEEGTEETGDKLEETEEKAESLDGQSATVSVSISGYDTVMERINNIRDNLRDLDGRSAEVKVSGSGNASGGVSQSLIRSIPMNAAGAINGIVTRATLTNIGWVGEAGTEAILHMGHAGGAVVPLSNRQYVRPFARAVAGEMGYAGGTSTVYNVYMDDIRINDDAEIRSATRDYISTLQRKAAMNRG